VIGGLLALACLLSNALFYRLTVTDELPSFPSSLGDLPAFTQLPTPDAKQYKPGLPWARVPGSELKKFTERNLLKPGKAVRYS
jgi:hypothetical protein